MADFEDAPQPGAPAPLPPPLTPPPGPTSRPKGRPAFAAVVLVALLFRLGQPIVDIVLSPEVGSLLGTAVLGAMLWWRYAERRRTERQGAEFTTDQVAGQLDASGLGAPAFPEDGTLLGASILVVNQRSKILEVITQFDIFGSAGQPLGHVSQIGQSGGKKLARIFTGLDQFFTHHFDIYGPGGELVLRLTRPRKIFRSKIHVFDGTDRFLGTIQQINIFWKIRFELQASNGQVVGHLRADNVRAWDFRVYDWHERVVATVVKSWEGWMRTAFTRADRYAVRIHEPLQDPLRQLTFAAALAVDLALKQDARGLG